VDMEFSVEVDSTADISTIDNKIRTSISQVLDNTITKLTQSEIVRLVKNISGVTNVVIPFRHFAKSDGSYEVGVVIPTGTSWTKVANDPLTAQLGLPNNAWITASSVLPYKTIGSGGSVDSYVGMLYGGENYTRLYSLLDIKNRIDPGFYIIGAYDSSLPATQSTDLYSGRIVFLPPSDTSNPSNNSYKVTYQVYGEIGPSDISISSTEYLRPGNINIDYIQSVG